MEKYEPAPPLPREPTALNVPGVVAPPAPAQAPFPISDSSSRLPPPPKFPSMSDVNISLATKVAEDIGIPQTSSPARDSDTSQHSSALQEDIQAAINVGAVPVGTGAKRATEVAQSLWKREYQVELNRLLSEGKDVYVPPDVCTNDLPVVRSARYSYVPIAPDSPAHQHPDTPASPGEIEGWNQVVSQNYSSQSNLAVAAAVASTGATTDVARELVLTGDHPISNDPSDSNPQSASPSNAHDKSHIDHYPDDHDSGPALDNDHHVGSTHVKKTADVSQTIFGGKFLTVPVKSRNVSTQPEPADVIADTVDVTKTAKVMLRLDASARINITSDYGLKGGHDGTINDAVPIDDKTLVTCSDDGKVCIWDMDERVVVKEFVPYDGDAVTMVYPVTDDDNSPTETIITLSKARVMRIWTVDDSRAIMLRSTQIRSSEKDLYMIVPVISKELKARAASAAAAAAVTTSDASPGPVEAGTASTQPLPLKEEPVSTVDTATNTEAQLEEKEEEKEKKRFSFPKVLSFSRNTSRKAVAS